MLSFIHKLLLIIVNGAYFLRITTCSLNFLKKCIFVSISVALRDDCNINEVFRFCLHLAGSVSPPLF